MITRAVRWVIESDVLIQEPVIVPEKRLVSHLKIPAVRGRIEKWNKAKSTTHFGDRQTHMTGSVGERFFTRCTLRIF